MVTRLRLGLLAALSGLLASTSPAWATAQYGGSRPAIEATVPAVPNPLFVQFTEELRAVSVMVNGPDTSNVTADAARIDTADRSWASVPLRDAGPGRYLVTWSTVSDVDGSKASGTFG